MVQLELDTSEESSVADFYAGKSVFITGGTGFLGKVIIEKLLYSCPQLDKLYFLIRKKKHLSVEQRIEEFLKLPIFERLRQENSEQLQKIIPVSGDVSLPNLGITQEDEKILLNEVSVVIHSAATVKFTEPLKSALQINYGGTVKVLELCQRMKNIKIFVYISTAYAFTSAAVLHEKLYPVQINVHKLYEEINKSPKIDEYKLLRGYPNTYLLTKALSESLVQKMRGNIPTVIVRPTIVSPAISEPLEGWIDNWYGATSFLFGVAQGFIRVFFTRRQNILDMIPVDYVSNLIVVAAAKCHTSKNIEVFHASTGSVKPITMGTTSDMFKEETVKNKSNALPYPKVVTTTNEWLFRLLVFFTEIIPACIADFYLILCGNPPKFRKIQSKLLKVRKASQYFLANSWIFKCDRTSALCSSLSAIDGAIFPCDPSEICWRNYMAIYFNGVKKYLTVKI